MLKYIYSFLDNIPWSVLIILFLLLGLLFLTLFANTERTEYYEQPQEWLPDQPRPRNVNEYVVYL